MANSIFDWEDEAEKPETAPPGQPSDHRPENDWETAPWSDPKFEKPDDAIHQTAENPSEIPPWAEPWDEPAVERQDPGQPLAMVPYQAAPETATETARRGGLAWSAGIVFFSSIVFMLFLGWLADLVFGSSPWGIVSGIVLGSILGFVQFFRITSQIFNSAKAESAMRPLMPRDDDER